MGEEPKLVSFEDFKNSQAEVSSQLFFDNMRGGHLLRNSKILPIHGDKYNSPEFSFKKTSSFNNYLIKTESEAQSATLLRLRTGGENGFRDLSDLEIIFAYGQQLLDAMAFHDTKTFQRLIESLNSLTKEDVDLLHRSAVHVRLNSAANKALVKQSAVSFFAEVLQAFSDWRWLTVEDYFVPKAKEEVERIIYPMINEFLKNIIPYLGDKEIEWVSQDLDLWFVLDERLREALTARFNQIPKNEVVPAEEDYNEAVETVRDSFLQRVKIFLFS